MLRQFSDKGAVDFVSFAVSLNEKISDPRYYEAFGDAFDLLDTGMKGELTKDDLIFGMQKLGETLTAEEAEEMLKTASKVWGVSTVNAAPGCVAAGTLLHTFRCSPHVLV